LVWRQLGHPRVQIIRPTVLKRSLFEDPFQRKVTVKKIGRLKGNQKAKAISAAAAAAAACCILCRSEWCTLQM